MRVQNTKMLPCSFDRSIENRRKVNWIFIKPIKPLNFGFFSLRRTRHLLLQQIGVVLFEGRI